jgi:hypothetical protein
VSVETNHSEPPDEQTCRQQSSWSQPALTRRGVLVCLHDTEITILLHTSPQAVSIVMPIDDNDGSINPRRK